LQQAKHCIFVIEAAINLSSWLAIPIFSEYNTVSYLSNIDNRSILIFN
jgi:hypothetical protein